MDLLKIVLTSALIAAAGGAGVFGITSLAISFQNLVSDARKYREWCEEQKEFFQDGDSW